MMKTKRWLTGLLILLVTVVSIPLYGIKTQAAENLLEGDWQYSVNNDDETVTVTKYFGEGGSVAVNGYWRPGIQRLHRIDRYCAP